MKINGNSRTWQLQEAKAKFSEVVDRAINEGPQFVTRRNRDTVVVMPAKEYEALRNANSSPGLIESLLAMPKGTDFQIPERDRTDVVPEKPLFGQ